MKQWMEDSFNDEINKDQCSYLSRRRRGQSRRRMFFLGKSRCKTWSCCRTSRPSRWKGKLSTSWGSAAPWRNNRVDCYQWYPVPVWVPLITCLPKKKRFERASSIKLSTLDASVIAQLAKTYMLAALYSSSHRVCAWTKERLLSESFDWLVVSDVCSFVFL